MIGAGPLILAGVSSPAVAAAHILGYSKLGGLVAARASLVSLMTRPWCSARLRLYTHVCCMVVEYHAMSAKLERNYQLNLTRSVCVSMRCAIDCSRVPDVFQSSSHRTSASSRSTYRAMADYAGVMHPGAAGGCESACTANGHSQHYWPDCWSFVCSAVYVTIPLGILCQQASAKHICACAVLCCKRLLAAQ